MRAREDEGARVGFEKQVPTCRVPRGRLDSKAATRWRQDRLCRFALSLPHTPPHPECASRPLALRERTAAGAQARCRVSLHRARINTPAGAYFRPRNLNFCTPRVEPGHLIFDLSPPSPIGDALNGAARGLLLAARWTAFLRGTSSPKERAPFLPSRPRAAESAGDFRFGLRREDR